MARPKLSQDQKRQQVNIRLNPADKAHLEAIAKREKSALAATAEALLSSAIAADKAAGESGPSQQRRDDLARIGQADDATISLLAQIAGEVALIESMTHKRWHKDRKTWAAVAQMMTQGPIMWNKIDEPVNDDIFQELARTGFDILQKKMRIIEELRGLGVVVQLRPDGFAKTNALAALTRGGIFGAPKLSVRSRERNLLLSLPDDVKERALEQFSLLEKLDKEEAENDAAVSEAVAPYAEAQMAGRMLYSDHRRAVAEAAKDAGEPYLYEDLR